MSKEYNTFGMIRYWFRVDQLGLSGKKRKYQNTLWWKRIGNVDRRKTVKELKEMGQTFSLLAASICYFFSRKW